MKPSLKKFLPAIAWFALSVFLLTLPGQQFPDTGMFKIPQQDKIIHLLLFFSLVYLFCRPFKRTTLHPEKKIAWFTVIAFLALAYGIAIEFIQKYYVPNRSFEVGDIVADGLGCLAGYLYSRRYFATNSW